MSSSLPKIRSREVIYGVFFTLLACDVTLVACSTPRGAGLQLEILTPDEAVDTQGAPVYDFAVFALTRAKFTRNF